MKKLLMCGAALALSGCATLTPEECRVADWREVGFQDGQAGYSSRRLADHAQACAKAGLRPDAGAWESGRIDGLRLYCAPDNGYRVGRAGEDYAGVCPPVAEPGFLDGYRTGRAQYEAEERYREAKAELRKAEEALGKATTDAERARLRDEVERLRLRLGLLGGWGGGPFFWR